MANSPKRKARSSKQSFAHEDEFKRLYDELSPRIYNYITLFLRNASAAEDITQEVFLKLYQQLQIQPHDQEIVPSWLFAVARNASIDWLKKNSNRYEAPHEPGYLHGIEDQSLSIIEKIELKDIMAKIDDIVAELPQAEREVFILRNMEKMKYKDIAAIINSSERNVKRYMKSALRSIAYHLKQMGMDIKS